MKIAELRRTLRTKTSAELQEELLKRLKEQFSLRLKRSATGNLRQVHLFKQTRRQIALIKTLITEKQAAE